MTPRSKAKATPKQLRRTGYFVASFAVFVLVFSIYREVDYAGFAKTATRSDARIVRIEAIREGKGTRHVLHYELDHRGKTYAYSDTTGGDNKLEELYTGSFNAFTGDDPPLKVGKTFGLLVSPYSPDDHRADRDKLTFPTALWLAPLLGIVFLSSIAAFLIWAGYEPKDASGAVIPPAKPRSQSSQVSSSRDNGVLRVRAKLDVPWPAMSAQHDDAQEKLRERMRALKAERGESAPAAPGTLEHSSTAEISFELTSEADAQLYEARVDFTGASGERASELIQRAVMLRAGQLEKLSATVNVPRVAKTLSLVLVLADRTTWKHDIAL